MKKNISINHESEIMPLLAVSDSPIRAPEIIPKPEKNNPYHPSPEIILPPKEKMS